ncbi:DNA-like protein [Hapsidospora chrysogenum ATCC 11550]|uniref:DNA-(apurinic or apyrimidinic site) endonuclease 2 n=1 Tax=Hapsidospora chrysogenum (strain ATCC 11550 / CBS 779.69 / DSM 880 / IAM 14645 / JCM 23072 / IMI 49137) TaxID=857340 RepID=A0A086TCD0_HAPC1|nr:DNA-like protein [Hapsidospora chrysogenum ATCC 11550]
MGFRITTWNVNGIRNPFSYQPWREKRTFQAMFDLLEADIVVMQETKIQRKDLQDDMVLVPGWDVYFSLPRHKKGYSGVAIYTRNSTCSPVRAEEGITGILAAPKSSTSYRGLPEDQRIGGYPRPGQLSGAVDEMTLDSEGRCVALEFPGFVLLGVYSPANRDESRDEFRIGFLEALDVRVRNLIAEGKQVILAGDLNVVRSEMDSSNVSESLRKSNMTAEEWISVPARRLFNQLLFEGSVLGERDEGREQPVLWDLCRCFHPTRKGMNTCWDTRKNTRPANYGSRIDYVLCSDGLKSWFVDANIQEGLMGSDHCPVFAVASDTVEVDGREVSISELVNPRGMFEGGRRLREWEQRDLLPLSAKLIPEFDRRQSIRDMFKRKTTGQSSSSPSPTPERSNSLAGGDADPRNADAAASTEETASRRAAAGADPGTGSDVSSFASPQRSSTSKRPAQSVGAPARSKRSRQTAESSTTNTKTKVAPGQKTLQGFFRPKDAAAPKVEDDAAPVTNNTTTIPPSLAGNTGESERSTPARPDPEEGAPPRVSESLGDASSVEPQRVFDPIEAKESWSKLLGKRVVPRCEHNEPCISLTTKKPGVNCGRSFYICPRPLGPSGEKEKGSEWRCGTFIWSSDWNGSTPQ